MRILLFLLTMLLTIQSIAQRVGVKAGLALATSTATGRQHFNPDFVRTVADGLNQSHLGVGVIEGYPFRPSIAINSKESLPTPQPTPTPPSTSPAKAVFAEIGGTGGFLSLNYDTRLTRSNKGLGLRVGVGTITDLNSFGLTVPFGLNYLAGEKSHFFEAALGATFFSFSEQNQDSWFSFTKLKFLAPYVWLGYRYQPADKRFFFRAGFNQFFAGGLKGFVAGPFPGLSFGYSIR
jgi:hypothetical protein